MTSPAMDIGLYLPYQAWIPSYWGGLKSKETVIGYCPDVSVTLAPLGLSHQLYWSLLWLIGVRAVWGYWLVFSLGSLHIPFGTLKGSQVRPSLIPLSNVSEVYGVFSNRLTFQFGEATKDKSNSLYCLEGFLGLPPTRNSKGFSCLVLGFLLDCLWLLG